MSKAFACLTDPHKRAYYDRTGHEDHNSHAAAAAQRNGQRGGGMHHDMDPQDLFNMMFGGGMGGGAFGMGPMHFGGFRGATMRQQRGQPQQAQQAEGNPLAGSLPPALSNLVAAFTRMGTMQKVMMVGMLLQFLPTVISLFFWSWWLMLVGVPLWFVSHEVSMFERRALYQPLQGVQPVRDAIRSAQPYASTYLRYTAPLAKGAQAAFTVFKHWASSIATM